VGTLYIKVKEGSDQEISDLSEEGKDIGRKVKTAAACLDELTITWKRS